MKEGHIFIQGEIIPWQDDDASSMGAVNVKAVSKQIAENKDAGNLKVHIHSPGGDVDEAFAIHDILVNSGKEIETLIEGLCASSATIIALAGKTRKMTENSTFIIHNPIIFPYPGDAEEMQDVADYIKAIENKIINFYASETGSDAVALDTWMKEEKVMTATEAKELGFINEIIVKIKAVANIRLPQTNTTMTKLSDTDRNLIQKVLDKINEFGKKIKSKMVTIATAEGVILDFGDQAETVEEIAVGMTATVDGSPATGSYLMPDGRTFVFDDSGALTEITEAESEMTAEEMQARITELEAENETLKAEHQTAFDKISKEFTALKASVTSSLKTVEKGEGGDGDDPPAPSRIASKLRVQN